MSMNAAMQQYVRIIQHVPMHQEALFANAMQDTTKMYLENVQVGSFSDKNQVLYVMFCYINFQRTQISFLFFQSEKWIIHVRNN
jgi:hypothetical protein